MEYEFNFPAIDKSVEFDEQIEKIVEELNETICELNRGDNYKAAFEAFNAVHALETMLRKFDRQELFYGYNKTILENASRGYYGEDFRLE